MERIEYHSLEDAYEARKRWDEHRHPKDDLQSKTVVYTDNVPDDAILYAELTKPVKIGQIQLTPEEKSRYNWRPSGSRPNIIEAQCVKGIAHYFGVTDWMSIWDSTLSINENYDIMKANSTTDQSYEQKIHDNASAILTSIE